MIRMMRQSNRSRRGFTVVEMLVTIGILVVVAAGVATIFASVGDTVAQGRKLSELNQFAARMERVMREDFERMTRDGFLVIVNKNANFGEDVKLYRGDVSNPDRNLFGSFSDEEGRIRRSDEIMFFARGDFETGRRAIASNMVASSSEAAIYYGHGQKRVPDLIAPNSPNNYFFNPQPWDNNYQQIPDPRLGVETLGQVNPNEFARDWSLLRQVTLLVNPSGRGQSVPQELYDIRSDNPLGRSYLQDSPRQIALQPAARSIFTALSGNDGTENHRWLYDASNAGPSPINPPPHYRTSGMVDIVTQDLSTIRSMIQALPAGMPTPVMPSDYFDYTPAEPRPNTPPVLITKDEFDTVYYQDNTTSPKPADALSLNLGRYLNNGGWDAGETDQIDNVRKWMIDALPSRWNLNTVVGSRPTADEFVAGVRYEDIPTRLMYTDDQFPNNDQGFLERAYAEANQEMLGASVFVPRCTEFIVEWSYGFVDNRFSAGNPDFKELIWYGLDRYVDSNNDGMLDPADDQRAAVPYAQRSSTAAGNDPVTGQSRVTGPDPRLIVGAPMRPMMVGGSPPPLSPDQIEIATFGFATRPDEPGAVWPWPKLIRITMRLGDPTDRDVEQTYQVVFEIPRPE